MLVAQVVCFLFDVCLSIVFVTLYLKIFSLPFETTLLTLLPHMQALIFHKLGRSWRKTTDKVR